MTKAIKYNKKRLKFANNRLESKGLILVEREEGLVCVKICTIENIKKGVFNCPETDQLMREINKDMKELGRIASYSINLVH